MPGHLNRKLIAFPEKQRTFSPSIPMAYESLLPRSLSASLAIRFNEMEMPQDLIVQMQKGIRFITLKDLDTALHSIRVALLCDAMAKLEQVSPEDRRIIFIAALMHDLGKVDIPDETLFAGARRYNETDWASVRQHPEQSFHRLLANHFAVEASIALFHHYFQPNRYPQSIPDQVSTFLQVDTNQRFFRFAEMLSLADWFDATCYREDNKLGSQQKPLEALMEIMKQEHPQFADLIDNVFRNNIFQHHVDVVRSSKPQEPVQPLHLEKAKYTQT